MTPQTKKQTISVKITKNVELDMDDISGHISEGVARLIGEQVLQFNKDAHAVPLDVDPSHWWEFPMHPGGQLGLQMHRSEQYVEIEGVRRVHFLLDQGAIQSGIELMAREDPESFEAVCDGSGDMFDSIRFVQYCLFGKDVFDL